MYRTVGKRWHCVQRTRFERNRPNACRGEGTEASLSGRSKLASALSASQTFSLLNTSKPTLLLLRREHGARAEHAWSQASAALGLDELAFGCRFEAAVASELMLQSTRGVRTNRARARRRAPLLAPSTSLGCDTLLVVTLAGTGKARRAIA